MTPRNESKQGGLSETLLCMGVVSLVATIGMLGLVRLANGMSPRIGDIMVLDPAANASIDAQTQIKATPVGQSATDPCILDMRLMRAVSGSLVIEAVESEQGSSYRVHWAGAHTSLGSAGLACPCKKILRREECQSRQGGLLFALKLIQLILGASS
jgi:hypothetical protein